MKQWPLFMDGIDRIYGFWPDNGTNGYQGMEWQREYGEEILDVSLNTQTFLKNETKLNTGFQWLNADRLPFVSQNNNQLALPQLDLFTESKYLVLHINQKIGSENSQAHFYIFFRDNKSNFGITESKEAYSTSEKAIIGRLAKNHSDSMVSGFLSHIAETVKFRETTRNILKAKNNLIEDEKSDFHRWSNYWLDDYLTILSERDGFNYVIEDNVRRKLYEKCDNLEQMKKSIENSFVYICNLYFSEPGDTIELETSYLFIEPEQENMNQASSTINNRVSRTADLLDRLERSAISVLNNGNNLTSAEVGKNMDRAITAPAISDALKKNKVRILQLLSQNPGKWPTIRKHFKPVVNLYEKNKGNLNGTL
nr:hypothetical protein [uncultured Carboxylicivirga sp.]